MFRTIQDGFHFVCIQACMLVLKYIILQALIVVLFTNNNFISVHIDQEGSLLIGKHKRVCRVLTPDGMAGFHISFVYINSQWYPEYFSCLLRLFYHHGGVAGRIVIRITDIKYRMTTSIIPLVPIPVHVLSGHLLECEPQVLCFGRFELIRYQV